MESPRGPHVGRGLDSTGLEQVLILWSQQLRERERYLQSLFCNVIRPRDTVIQANCNPKRANFCNGLCNGRNCNESGHMYRAMQRGRANL